AELDQVFGDVVGGVAVVDPHARRAVARVFRGRDDAHQLDPVREQFADQFHALGHRRRQHQAGQARALDQVDQVGGQQRRGRVAGMDLQAVAGFAAGGQHAVLHADDVVRVRVVVDHAQRIRLGAAQAARGRVGTVLEFGDGFVHPRAGAGAHAGLVVDDPRDGLQRDLGEFGDIFDGGSAHGTS
ncbi:hypothetical protein CATMIT_01699, partial [Catenibacterium mitsuokai DSM 15897]